MRRRGGEGAIMLIGLCPSSCKLKYYKFCTVGTARMQVLFPKFADFSQAPWHATATRIDEANVDGNANQDLAHVMNS
jgi:hypothetical protein